MFRGFYLFKLDLSIALSFLLLIFILIMPANANGECKILQKGYNAKIVQIVDGDSLLLDNGDKVRLIGIQSPKLALGRNGFLDWPLANEAKSFLEEIALNKEVRLEFGGARKDRHGRVLAHLFILGEKEIWLQKAMVESGFARVYSFADNRFCLDKLLRAEAIARVERKNIWANDFYKIGFAEQPKKLLNKVDHYELVEGRVMDAKKIGSRIYLNFGANWREDFTIVLEKHALRVFEKSGINVLDYQDMLIRVRGWVENRDGPRIEVTHPEQIEVLAIK